ncbi:MAG TPA: ATP-binding cassette domain-containing protein, partial [Spirochaetia bacterium]|nr:ATP-binding cassette domain-containing protein [Spirochaetia bacterium]
MAEYRIEIRNVSKHFGSVMALDDVSFGVRPGEVVGLIGDNGAGKSTAIKIISGFHRPSSGSILWEGKEIVMDSPEGA